MKMWIPLKSTSIAASLRTVDFGNQDEVVRYGMGGLLLEIHTATSRKLKVGKVNVGELFENAATALERLGQSGEVSGDALVAPKAPKAPMDEDAFAGLLEELGKAVTFSREAGKFVLTTDIAPKGYLVQAGDTLERRTITPELETIAKLATTTADLPTEGLEAEDLALLADFLAQTNADETAHVQRVDRLLAVQVP